MILPLDRISVTCPLMRLTDELAWSLGGSTLSIEENTITVKDLLPPTDCGMSTATDELKSKLKLFVNVVLFKRTEGTFMTKLLFERLPDNLSRESRNKELRLLLVAKLVVFVTVFVSLLFRKFHEFFESSLVRIPAVSRTN